MLGSAEPFSNEGVSLSYLEGGLSTTAIHKRLMRYREAAAVSLTAHRLRNTAATQLLNAGCRITSIQKFLGHKELSSTMIYARVHDRTVADDYYTAMERVEQRLELLGAPAEEQQQLAGSERTQLLALTAQLA